MKTKKRRTNTKASKVLEHLQKYGSITSWEAIDKYGATRLSAIIYNLRDDGYDIVSERIPFTDRFGDSHSFNRYILKNKDSLATAS